MRSAMRRLSAATGVLVFLLSVQSQAKICKFDMGPEGSPVWEGFTQVTAKTVYSAKTGYGWRKKAGRGITHRLRGVPDALACDIVGANDSTRGYYSGAMEFLLDVPNGEYTVYLLTGDMMGWSIERGYSMTQTVALEGKVRDKRSLSWTEWLAQVAYKNMNLDYKRGDDLYDKYIAPRFGPKVFNVTVSDGQLSLSFRHTPVAALIIYPSAEAEQVKAFIVDLNKKRRAAFGYKDDTPKPTGALQGVSKQDKEKGYVVFYPHYMHKVYPFDLPKVEQLAKELRAFVSLGELEPVTFAIHPLKDLGKCRVIVSDLKSQVGATLSASHWDVRVVRYLELPEKRGRRSYRIEPLLLMKKDAVEIEQGINKQFWLTVKVPEDAGPGRYTGNVAFKPENAPESRIVLKLRVLPYRLKPLEDNSRYSGLWHIYPKYGLTRDQIAADLTDHGINVIHNARAPRAELVNGEIVLGDTKEAEEYLEHFRKAGFPMKLIVWQSALNQAYQLANEPRCDPEWLKAHGGRSDHQVKKSFSKKFDDVHRKLAKAIDDLYRKKGWPEIIFYESGEGGGEGYWGIWTEVHLLKNLKDAGVKGTTSVVGLAALDAELPYLYAAQIYSLDAGPEVRDRIRKAGARLWLYGFGYNRFQRGFLFWKTGAEGCAIEGYAHVYGDPYNEFDGGYAYEGEVWPSPDGPVPTLAWEHKREGIDDCKYVSHLDLLIKEAAKSPKKAVRDAAAEARSTLEGIMAEINPDINHYRRHGNPDAVVMDVWRWKVASRIAALQDVMRSK